ncbi:MAG: UDP-N-acetylmuramoyl-tripeptide--D-alanyl-D-alanine ligase [Rickettsiales bacterium]|nr:UDP-N-acetylmuramoyl-tripeptide--D-alanyl-D-alanine ligase [Rickettsiales bacterium]
MKNFLWDNQALKRACPTAILNDTCTGNRICINSKEIQPNDIFVAFKGENVDGHNYVTDAFKKGASCAIVEYKPKNITSPNHLMIVPNVKEALKNLAIFNRKRSKAKIIGITGSVGKTSTKEAMYIACSSMKKSYCSIKNFNNDLGLPISLASMPIDTECGIFEVGMNHKGEIAELTKILRPHLALITKIAKAHIENFNSIHDIALAKGEIFSSMTKDGIAILNGDDNYTPILTKLALDQGIKDICYFGENSKNESYLLEYNTDKDVLNTIKAKILGKEITYKIKARGRHQALNSIAVLTATTKIGINLETAAKSLLNFSNVEGRGELLRLTIADKNILILDDSYNANPTSIQAALKVMNEITKKNAHSRTIAVLGDMIELGTEAKREHMKLAEPFEKSGINKLITVGHLMQNLFDSVPTNKRLTHFLDYKKAIKSILSLIEDGDCILLKGSHHNSKIYEIVKYLKEQAT